MTEKKYISKYPNYRILKPNGQIIQFSGRRYVTSDPDEQKFIEGLKVFGTADLDFDRPASPAALPDQRMVQLEEEVKAKDAKISELEAELERLRALAAGENEGASKKTTGKKQL